MWINAHVCHEKAIKVMITSFSRVVPEPIVFRCLAVSLVFAAWELTIQAGFNCRVEISVI